MKNNIRKEIKEEIISIGVLIFLSFMAYIDGNKIFSVYAILLILMVLVRLIDNLKTLKFLKDEDE